MTMRAKRYRNSAARLSFMRRTTIPNSSFLIRAELSSTIKGRHAPRANPAPRFNFLYHTVRDREKQSRERKICIFETSVVEYILQFSVFCKNKRGLILSEKPT